MPYGNIMNLFWPIMVHAFLLTFYSEISLRTWRVLEVFKTNFQNLKFFKNLSGLIVQVRVAFRRIDDGGGHQESHMESCCQSSVVIKENLC